MTVEETIRARRRSGWAGVAGVSVALGATELFAGISNSVPSAISAIGTYVVEASPSWLETFAISAFGTSDKAVLAISIFAVALIVGWFLGKASVDRPTPIFIGFAVAGIIGFAAQSTQLDVSGPLAFASTLVSMGLGLATWYGIKQWSDAPLRDVTDTDVTDIVRRRLMLGLAGAATVTVISIGIGRGRIRGRAEAQIAALSLADPVETQADPTAAQEFGLLGVAPIVVGNATFYRIDTALIVPTIDPEEWTGGPGGRLVVRRHRLDAARGAIRHLVLRIERGRRQIRWKRSVDGRHAERHPRYGRRTGNRGTDRWSIDRRVHGRVSH